MEQENEKKLRNILKLKGCRRCRGYTKLFFWKFLVEIYYHIRSNLFVIWCKKVLYNPYTPYTHHMQEKKQNNMASKVRSFGKYNYFSSPAIGAIAVRQALLLGCTNHGHLPHVGRDLALMRDTPAKYLPVGDCVVDWYSKVGPNCVACLRVKTRCNAFTRNKTVRKVRLIARLRQVRLPQWTCYY